MERNSILLASALTAVLVAAVVFVGRANGAFGAHRNDGGQEAFAAESLNAGQSPTATPEDRVLYVYPDGSPAPDPNQPQAGGSQRQLADSGDTSGRDGVTYVYEDGSPAPDPNSPDAGVSRSSRHGDDDDDYGDDDYDDDDKNEHEREEWEHEDRTFASFFRIERDDR